MAVRRRRAASSALGGEREREGERMLRRMSETAESERKRKKDILIHTIEGGYRLQRRNKLKNG